MSLLARRRPRSVERAQPGFTMDQWVRLFGGSTSVTSSSVQSIDIALSHSVVWRCAMKNAATLASFPVHTYRGREVVTDPTIVAAPAPGEFEQASWVFAAALSMYLRGGASGMVGPDAEAARGRPRSCYLLHPDRVDWSSTKGWTVDGQPVDPWPNGPFWHVPLYVLPGSPMGLNPLQFARRSLFPGLAAQEFGANFFRDGAHPSTIIAPEKDPGPDGAKALKARYMESVHGTNREPIVVPQSVKVHQMQVNPEDSQFIETMRLTDEQVCRYMGTPPEEVGISPGGSSLTYANREQRKQDYLQELLYPKRQLEAGWSSLIPRPQVVKLNPDGLLQADLLTRYQSYEIASRINATGDTFLSIDEMRDLENRAPLPKEAGLDVKGVKQLSVAEIVQKVYLGVGVVITADEAREIINAAGGDLDIPGPFRPPEADPGGADG